MPLVLIPSCSRRSSRERARSVRPEPHSQGQLRAPPRRLRGRQRFLAIAAVVIVTFIAHQQHGRDHAPPRPAPRRSTRPAGPPRLLANAVRQGSGNLVQTVIDASSAISRVAVIIIFSTLLTLPLLRDGGKRGTWSSVAAARRRRDQRRRQRAPSTCSAAT
jgi:hypothetical protein